MDIWSVALLTALLAAPLLIDRYLRTLPVAPACPTCRSIARERRTSSIADIIPFLSRTFAAECIRCGWHGRMRWKLAGGKLHNRDS